MFSNTLTRLVILCCMGLLATTLAIANNATNQEALAKVMSMKSDVDYGKYLASECLTCHSPVESTGTIPQIHGKEKAYLVSALLEYKHMQRDNEVMSAIAGTLSSEDIAALSTYLSSEY